MTRPMPKSPWLTFDQLVWRRWRRTLVRISSAALAASALSSAVATESAPPRGIERLPDGRDTQPGEDSVYFAAASATLDDEAHRVIRRHIAKLEASPHLCLTIVAHTDELGSTGLEIARGQDRLNVVLRVLEDARIAARRIRSINLGSDSSPANDCSDDACRRSRRRIDFLFHR